VYVYVNRTPGPEPLRYEVAGGAVALAPVPIMIMKYRPVARYSVHAPTQSTHQKPIVYVGCSLHI